MPEVTKPGNKPAEPKASTAPQSEVSRASESGDPAVQQLLAQRQAAAMNEDEELLADIDKQLVDLGFVEYKH
jgi:hypothetical protein